MTTLADEILTALPRITEAHPEGASIQVFAEEVGASVHDVRRAARDLNANALADLMRRPSSREQFLVPLRYRYAEGFRYCSHCAAEFEQPHAKRSGGTLHYSNRRCCSRKCGIAWSWTRPGVKERRSAGIKIAHDCPEQRQRLADHNARRWAKPEEHQRLSEQNRREWSDPTKKALRSQGIRAAHSTPEKRKFYSDMRKAMWRDPEMRLKMTEAAARAKGTPEFKAYFSELCRQRWKDPVWRAKWLPAVRKNAAKAGRASQRKRRERKAVLSLNSI